MPEHPLAIIEDLDSRLFEVVDENRKLAFAEGELPLKHKILIALALDASHGAVDGVRSLARFALRTGVSKREIAETLRVTQYISGVGSIYTASRAIKELFED